MKNVRRITSLVLTLLLVAAMMVPVFADTPSDDTPAAGEKHVIQITNTDQNVKHVYVAYKVFSGSLDAQEQVLSNIAWGEGVNGSALLTALQGAEDPSLQKDGANVFASCTTAADVAAVLATFDSTSGAAQSAGAIDAVAAIIAENLATKAGDFQEKQNGIYECEVEGDGYYFIKDVTENLNSEDGKSDTLSKYLLAVVKDTTIVAKDTGMNPDKEIDTGDKKVKADTAAIGDTVNFEVTIDVPNTVKYDDHFWFVMNDKLPDGITFTGITSVKIDSQTLLDIGKQDPVPNLESEDYTGETGYYELKVDGAAANYAWEAATYDPVLAAGGQEIKLTFKEFKKFVEKKGLIGKTVTIKYTGVVNDDAEYTATENENEVTFDYSNDPNHDYDGDNPGPGDDDVTGTTPESKTRTYTTSLKILKVDENNDPLEGATFELKGDALNRTVLTGYKFVEESYEPKNGEVIDATASYWKLTDGSYTTTDPATLTNTTQYADTTKKYYKVTYTQDEVAAQEKDIVIVTGADGVAEFVGLNEGTYSLEEIAAPDGYNKIEGEATIAIAWVDPESDEASDEAKAQGGYTITVTGNAAFGESIAWNATDKQFEVTIQNNKGQVLPSTGGIGTTIFYVAGGILVLAALILLVTKRRVNTK